MGPLGDSGSSYEGNPSRTSIFSLESFRYISRYFGLMPTCKKPKKKSFLFYLRLNQVKLPLKTTLVTFDSSSAARKSRKLISATRKFSEALATGNECCIEEAMDGRDCTVRQNGTRVPEIIRFENIWLKEEHSVVCNSSLLISMIARKLSISCAYRALQNIELIKTSEKSILV